VGYLTLDEIPSGRLCRPLFIPDDPMWLALFGGALTELTLSYNYQQFGTLTPQEMAAACQAVIDEWYANSGECDTCVTPDGDPLFRLNAAGETEQFDGGAFVTPYGDWALPPVPTREEPTSEERKCAAAANAVYVLEQLYEEVSDQYNSEVDPALGLAAMIIAVGTFLAFPFAPILGSIMLFLELPFAAFYYALEAISEDLWDAAFTEKLTCVFFTNATESDGQVTFDVQGIITQIGEGVNLFDPTVSELRLYGQVNYLLRFLGNDAINNAGGVTVIEDYDCSLCPCNDDAYDIYLDFTESSYGWTITTGSWFLGNGFSNTGFDVTWRSRVSITVDPACPSTVESFEIYVTGTQEQTRIIDVLKNGTSQFATVDGSNTPITSPFGCTGTAEIGVGDNVGFFFLLDNPTANSFYVTGARIQGHGEPPPFVP